MRCQQHPVFPGGHPSKYWLGSTLLNFSDRTRTGVFSVIWPLASERGEIKHFDPLTALANSSWSSPTPRPQIHIVQRSWTVVHKCNTRWRACSTLLQTETKALGFSCKKQIQASLLFPRTVSFEILCLSFANFHANLVFYTSFGSFISWVEKLPDWVQIANSHQLCLQPRPNKSLVDLEIQGMSNLIS